MAQVFMIDDEVLFAKLVRQRLASSGHEVVYKQGASGALSAVRQGTYDVILVDVQMPDIDGPRLVDCFRSRDVSGAKIILMSSLPESQVVGLAREAGADAAFCKTTGLEPLDRLVKRVLVGV